jgi:hypothetical protein
MICQIIIVLPLLADTLRANEMITKGQYLMSGNGCYKASFGESFNFTLEQLQQPGNFFGKQELFQV